MIDAGGVSQGAQASQVRAALYLDFDNVFTGLRQLDPGAAIRFAEEPGAWLERLASSATVARPRRWLILRCYMNPAGFVSDGPGQRIYFSRFRPFFTGAGFDVIDCPRLTHTKNAADIRLVLDAVDALRAEVTYEEYVIASGALRYDAASGPAPGCRSTNHCRVSIGRCGSTGFGCRPTRRRAGAP